MSGTLTRLEPPVRPAALVDEVRAFLRLDGREEDALLAQFVDTATAKVEEHSRRALVQQSFVLSLERWPVGSVRIPRPPLISIDQVTVRQGDGMWSVVAPERYLSDRVAEPGLLIPTAGLSQAACSGVRVEFAAGYGEDWNAVPAPLRQAVVATAAYWFEQRETGTELAPGAKQLIAGYRVIGL